MTTPRPRAPTITIDTSAVNPTGLNPLWLDDRSTATDELRKRREELSKSREKIRKLREERVKTESRFFERLKELVGHIPELSPRAEVEIDKSLILDRENISNLFDDLAEREKRFELEELYYDRLERQYYASKSDTVYQARRSIYSTATHIDAFESDPTDPRLHNPWENGLIQNFLASASHTTSTDGTSAKKMFEIPGLISSQKSSKEHRIAAMGDTAAKYNFMKEDYAIRKGFTVRREQVRRVAITRDHGVTTTGTVEINFRFRGENERHALIFHLLPECIDDVILGKRFLKLTETFSVLKNFTRRVKKHVHDGLSKLHLFYLGDSAPKFTGLLNGRPREALADSGSNALIMDEEFARKMGLPIRNDSSHRNTVYFADNTTARTCGMTYNVRWEFGLGGNDKEHMLDFHILKNAPADVILSDEFLFKTSAFSEYDCYLVDEDDEDEDADAYFYGIKIDTSYNNVPVSIPEQMSEDARRDAEDDRIDNLPVHEQDIARQHEHERRAAWDARHVADNLDGSSTQGSASSVSVQTNGLNNSPPATTALPMIAVSSVVPTPPPLSGLTRWRFKLKRKKKAQISLSP